MVKFIIYLRVGRDVIAPFFFSLISNISTAVDKVGKPVVKKTRRAQTKNEDDKKTADDGNKKYIIYMRIVHSVIVIYEFFQLGKNGT